TGADVVEYGGAWSSRWLHPHSMQKRELRARGEGASTATPNYSESKSGNAQSQKDSGHDKDHDEEGLQPAPTYAGLEYISRTKHNSQALLLISGSSIWVLPGLSLRQLDAILLGRGIATAPCRPSQTSGSFNGQGRDKPSQSASRRISGAVGKSRGNR